MKYVVIKKGSTFRVGDVLSCWDEELNRSITGYVLKVSKNKELGDYDLHIRWNDPFVAFEVCGSTDGTERIKQGLWKFYPMNL